MQLLVALALLGPLVWLTFFPMFDATKQGRDPWPWIVGGFLAGPLAGLAYLMTRRATRMAAQRSGVPAP